MAGKENLSAFAKRLAVDPKRGIDLARLDARGTPGASKRSAAEAAMPGLHERLNAWQEKLYAENRQALLVVLQAMDTGGKDGAIRHVFGPLNPQGVRVASFKKPTEEELAHDYLWRIHKAVPRKGIIGVFNRSHYESLLVERVRDLAPREAIARRFDEINAFESLLHGSGVRILKFYLHIDKAEQKNRLQSRLDREDKHWKFSSADLAERTRWDEYMAAFADVLKRCSTPIAPWYAVPSNRKWYRNWAVARIVLHALEDMNPQYPPTEPGLAAIRIDA